MSRNSIIVTFPYSLGLPGGGPLDCRAMLENLALANVNVTVVVVATHSHGGYPRRTLPEALDGRHQYDELRQIGVDVRIVEPSKLHYSRDGIGVRHVVRALISETKVDAVISYWQEGRYLAAMLKKAGVAHAILAAASYGIFLDDDSDQRLPAPLSIGLRGIRNVVKRCAYWPYQDYVIRPLKKLRADWLIGASYRSADIVFARSKFTGEEVKKYFGVDSQKIRTAYCGVDEEYSEISRSVRKCATRLFFFGAFVREKGVFDVLKALQIVTARSKLDTSLRIAGWGDMAGLQNGINELGLASRVECVGKLNKADLMCSMAWADIAILPSYSESFGLAAAEAQASGLPVIAYAVAAVPEVVLDQVTGWLVEPGRYDLLADKIEEAMANPKKTIEAGERGRQRVAETFTWRQSTARILEELQHLKS